MINEINLLLQMMKYLKLHGRKFARLPIRMSSTSYRVRQCLVLFICLVFLFWVGGVLVESLTASNFYLMVCQCWFRPEAAFCWPMNASHTFQLDLVDISVNLVLFM
jgi:hypothetical protein